MDDQKRKKILAGGLILVVLVFLLRPGVDGWLRGPIRDLQNEIATAETASATLLADEIQFGAAMRNLAEWKSISLPFDKDNAQRLYREWIQALAEECGFSRIEVVPGSKSVQKEYSSVSVELKRAETDLPGLTRFLYLFDQSDMLHRIDSLSIDSPGPKGNPRLTVSLIAEGLSAAGAENRLELLTRTPLAAPVNDADKHMATASNDGFPIDEDPANFEPFLVRIDRELIKVDAVDETGWQITRGVEGTQAAAHDANAVVEYFPVAWDRRQNTQEQYAALVKSSPFVIPSPPKKYTPRLTGISDKTIKPGEEVKLTAKADGMDPDLGAARFTLLNAAEGMTIDPASGEFLWNPAADLVPGVFTAKVSMTQENHEDVKTEVDLKITIRKENAAPTITVRESAIVVLSREFTTTVTAADEDSTDTLTFSLGGGSPEGLTIDATTGQLKWTPPKTFTPGKYDVEIKVTDSGSEPKSTTAKIALDVQDDFAALTLLSGIVGKDGVMYAWFRNKATNKVMPLKSGEKLTVSEISADLLSIADRYVTMQDADGVWKLKLGEPLRSRELIEPVPNPVVPQTPAAPETPTIETPAVE